MRYVGGFSRVYSELGIRKDLMEKFKKHLKKLVMDVKGARIHLENVIELSERITPKGAEKVASWHEALVRIQAVLEGMLKEVEGYLF